MSVSENTRFESFVPVYDAVPEKWDDAKPFIVENLKALANAVNIRTIGWYLDEEVLTGEAFIPVGSTGSLQDTSSNYRSVLRKVIPFGALTAGVNQKAHFLNIDANFTLIQLYGAATNASAYTGVPLPNNTDSITYDSQYIIITVSANYTRAYAVIEYLTEL